MQQAVPSTVHPKLLQRKASNGIGVHACIDNTTLTAAWDFWEQHKKSVQWDLVVLNPSLVSDKSLYHGLGLTSYCYSKVIGVSIIHQVQVF